MNYFIFLTICLLSFSVYAADGLSDRHTSSDGGIVSGQGTFLNKGSKSYQKPSGVNKVNNTVDIDETTFDPQAIEPAAGDEGNIGNDENNFRDSLRLPRKY